MLTVGENAGTAAGKLQEAFARFRRLHRRVNPVAGLAPSEIGVLMCIKREVPHDGTGIKVSDISNLLNVASPSITQQINSLETHGLVERRMDKEDRRVVRVTLTDKGECLVDKASEAYMSAFNGLVEYLGEEESEHLAKLLSRVVTYFEEVNGANTIETYRSEG